MRFTPKSSEELARESAARLCLPPGVYDCEVLEAEDAISKAGNEMIAMVLAVYDSEGQQRKVRDWLLESVAYKLRHACETFGLAEKYEAGELEAGDFIGRPGRVKLKVTKDPNYPDKNSVADYEVPSGPLPAQSAYECAQASAGNGGPGRRDPVLMPEPVSALLPPDPSVSGWHILAIGDDRVVLFWDDAEVWASWRGDCWWPVKWSHMAGCRYIAPASLDDAAELVRLRAEVAELRKKLERKQQDIEDLHGAATDAMTVRDQEIERLRAAPPPPPVAQEPGA